MLEYNVTASLASRLSKAHTGYRHRNFSNNTGTTHYDPLQGSYWADQKDSHNEVIMTSLQGQ